MNRTSAFFLLPLLLLSCGNIDHSIVISQPEFTSGIEGPAVSSDGKLFVVNYKSEGTIASKAPKDSLFELCVTLPVGSIGNGIRFKNDSICFIADYAKHQVLMLNVNQRKTSVYVKEERMNQPNDLAIAEDGVLYASDPNWEEKSGKIWRILPDQTVELLEERMGTTNGIEVSPNNVFLYVNESVQRKVWRFHITAEGVNGKTLFYEFTDGGLDGMRCDQEGNLYIARYDKGTVAVLSPEGELIRTVRLHGEKPTNVAFGGSDGKTVFVTLQDKKWIEAFKAPNPGRSFQLKIK